MILRRLILILTTLLLSHPTYTFNCSRINTCECTRSPNRGYDLFCPNSINFIVKVSFDFDGEQALEIDCERQENYINFLPTTYLPPETPELDLRSLRFKRCSLPENVTVKDVMNHLKIVTTESFRISGSDLRNISRSDLNGLENIENLEILLNTIENVPEDLIYDLKKLEFIDIKSNNIVIPQRFFEKAQNLKSIEIAENSLPENTTGIFRNQKILKHLNMWMMDIKTIDAQIFEGLVNLEKLDLSLNKISALPFNLFKDLHNLKVLSLKRNAFETLPFGLFDNNPNLETIHLGENIRMTSLPENLLSNKKFLKEVYLDHCKLTTLPSSFFNNSNALETIDLSLNQLQTLPNDLLNNKSKLRYLNLENNYLKTLPLEFFIHLVDLEYLNLNDNYLQLTSNNFQKQLNLKKLFLSNNNLKTLFASTLRNLRKIEHLDLSYNNLTLMDDSSLSYDSGVGYWSVFAELSTLETLKLEKNNISTMFVDWHVTLLRLKKLELSNNTFTELSFKDIDFKQSEIEINLEHNFIRSIDLSQAEVLTLDELSSQSPNPIPSYSNSKKITINLNFNPLNCGCNLYDLYRYFDQTIDPQVHLIYTLKTNNLTCSSPENMAGKRADTIKSESFICEFDNEICPEIATCYYQPNGKVLTMDLSDKGLQHAPELAAFKSNQSFIFNKHVILLQNNKIKEMPQPGMGYEKVHALDLSNNLIERIDWIPENLTVLRLHNNALTHLSDKTLSTFNHSQITNLSLYNNPWTCNCSTVSFLKFIQDKFETLGPLQNITCKDTNQQISDLSTDELCPLPTYIIIFLCVFVAFLGILIAILTFLYNRYNIEIKVWLFAHQQCLWFVTEDEIDRDKIYDAFISYSHQDEDFIISELIEKLEEGPNPYKLCIHVRDWIPGEFISRNIANSVADSRRTIVVLSKNFLQSEWGKMEFRVAHKQALEESRTRVIIILLGEIPMDDLDDEIKAYLNTNTYLKWGDPWFWDKLRYALPHSHVKNYIHEKVRLDSDRLNLFDPVTPPLQSIQTTPPLDKMINDPLNVSVVNGTLVNGYVNKKMDDVPNQLFGTNTILYECEKINDVNNKNKLNDSNYIIR